MASSPPEDRDTASRTGRTSREERLEIRLTREQKWLLERAAAVQGSSVAEFARQAMQAAALKTVTEQEVLKLSPRDQEAFAVALLDPSQPNVRLRRAYARYRESIGG